MTNRVKIYISLILIAAISALLMFGLTYNIGYQWEDIQNLFKWESEATWTGQGFNNANEQIDWDKLKSEIANTFLQIKYGIKPLQNHLQFTVLASLFKNDLFKYHIYRDETYSLDKAHFS